MKDAVIGGSEEAFRNWVGLMLLAIGWNAPIHEWIGGTIMAMGGASIARAWRPERDRGELWAVIGGAVFASHIVGALCLRFAPDWPIPIVMALSGFLSRMAIRLVLDVAERISGRGSRIADRVIDRVLPADDKRD